MKPVRIADFLKLSDEEIIKHIEESGFLGHLEDIFLKSTLYNHQRSLTIFGHLKLIGVDYYEKVEKKPKPSHIQARVDMTMINRQYNAWAPILIFYKPKMSGEDKILGITFYPSGDIAIYRYIEEYLKMNNDTAKKVFRI